MTTQRANGIRVLRDAVIGAQRAQINDGTSVPQLYRRAATYVDKVLTRCTSSLGPRGSRRAVYPREHATEDECGDARNAWPRDHRGPIAIVEPGHCRPVPGVEPVRVKGK
jgi:hypothetical protein